MSDKLSIHGMDTASMTEVVRKFENKGGVKIGLDYLPFYESATEETMWDIVKSASPMASFRAVDGEAEIGGKMAFDRAYADIQSIARKERLNTSDLRKIKEAGMLPVVDGATSYIAQVGAEAKKRVIAALERSKLAVDNRIEWMQINALLGKIEYKGKVAFSVDYGVLYTGVEPATPWSTTATATPIEDIIDWQEKVRLATGIVVDTIIMSRTALNYIRKNSGIAEILKYTSHSIVSFNAAKQYLQDNTGLNVIVYDTTYTAEDGSGTTRFLPENKIIMLPSKTALPEGFGDTARVGHPLANYTPGYYYWEDEKKDPYSLEVGVGMDAFPRIKNPEVLLNAKVY